MNSIFFFFYKKKKLTACNCKKECVQKFSAILHGGGTFIISNFKVIMTNKGYRLVSNDLNIISLLTTSVKECNEESELIPMHAFEFTTYDCINSRLNDNSYLVNHILVHLFSTLINQNSSFKYIFSIYKLLQI